MSSFEDRIRAKFAEVERSEADMWEYQGTAVEFLYALKFAALFIDTGLGKTIVVLTLLVRLWVEGRYNKVLIVAPVRVATQTWPNEIAAWEHTAFFNYSVIRAEDNDEEVISAGKAAYEAYLRSDESTNREINEIEDLIDLGDGLNKAEKFAERNSKKIARRLAGKAETAKKVELRNKRRADPAWIHIINREALEWLVDQHSKMIPMKRRGVTKYVRKIVDWPYDIVVIDESSAFKDHSTIRFKALWAVRAQGFIKRLIELTATPAAESYMGLFAQVILMDKGKRLGRFITKFRKEHFEYNSYSRTYKILKGAGERISAKIADICLVMKSGDYLDEEEPLFLDRKMHLTPAQLKQYEYFEREFILDLDDGVEIEAVTAAALSGKLLQLASGAVYDEGKQVHIVHDHKIEDLRELQEELQGSPLLVAYWYKSSLARLKKAFPHAVVMDKAGSVAARRGPWNSGKIEMLLVHPASVAFGLNMQHGPGHDVYMFDQCWSWEKFYQLYRRLHRQGQKLRVRVHLPQMIGTKDTMVVEALNMKEDAQERLFEWIRQARRRFAQRKA